MTRLFVFVLSLTAFSAGPAHIAFADTIDAAAQPFIVGGGFLAGLAFVALGVFFILRGLGTRRLARESLSWPTAEATILETRVRSEWRNPTGKAGARYEVFIPEARYSYTVGGKGFEGHIIRAGIDQFGYGAEVHAQAQLDPYKTGASAPVRYDPADPAVAVLETTEYGGARNIFGGAIFVLVGIGGFVLAAWANTLATH
jgi:hypothetical protein